MTTICWFSATGGDACLLATALERCRQHHPEVNLWARSAVQLTTSDQQEAFAAAALQADALVLSLHGGTESCPAWEQLHAGIQERRRRGAPLPYLHLQVPSGDDDALLAAQDYADGLADGTWTGLLALLDAGGADNIATALQVLAARTAERRNGTATSAVPAPVPVPIDGIAHPRHGTFTSLADFAPLLPPQAPRVLLLYPRTYYLEGNTGHVDDLVAAIEARGAVAIPVFCYRLPDLRRGAPGLRGIIDRFARDATDPTRAGQAAVDVIVDLHGMSSTIADPTLADVYPDLDVAVLHALTSYGPRAAWEATAQGMGAMDVSLQAAQPEFDGELITTIIATREAQELDPVTGAILPRMMPMAERIEAMAQLAINWARLRRTPNAHKRVAIVFHHHPPRDDRIGCASGLDTFESVRLLLERLADDGYDVPQRFATADELARTLRAGLTGDRRWLTPEVMHARAQAHVDAATSAAWDAQLPERVRADLRDTWGPAPGTLFVHDGELSFAGHLNGNVFLTIQPPRGVLELVDEQGMHDPVVPPPHHYLAHYRWIREVFGAHAVIHVGTHGSLEWLPGKALGLSPECYPDVALATLPNIYPYIVNNPGEGTQAKRRSSAALVDHLTPPMRRANLHGELLDVEAAQRDFEASKAHNVQARESAVNRLWDTVQAAGLDTDLGLTREEALADASRFATRVRHHLEALADNQIFDGLHVLGQLVSTGSDLLEPGAPEPDPQEMLVEYLAQLTRLPDGEVPSLRESVLAAMDGPVDTAGDDTDAGRDTAAGDDVGQGEAAHRMCLALLGDLVAALDAQPATTSTTATSTTAAVNPEVITALVDDIIAARLPRSAPAVALALQHVAVSLLPRLRAVGAELESVVRALSGGFVAPGPSGAATRGDTAMLPTGRNFFSLDPRTMPTRAAWDVGVALAEDLLARYADSHPDAPYPRTVGMIFWGTPAMRSGGEYVAEFLHLQGLRPEWNAAGIVTGLHVVPLTTLARPRVDVTARISGFFRDAFPNLVDLLDRATRMVAVLDEPEEDNLVRAHVRSDAARYRAEGLPEDEVLRRASLRIFGCPPGTYGAGVEELIETGRWTTTSDLGEAYITASSHAYGQGVYGDVRREAFTAQLGRMDATVKNEDTREYDMLSCTDFYNYYGGLIAAATTVRGQAPDSFVGDSSDPRAVITRTTTEEARLVLRSRILNPTWIEGLQRHGYKGAGDASKVLDILIGWDATADVVDDGLWDRVARRYALDPGMQAWFARVNPHALHNIVSKLLDAAQRGLWDADEELREQLQATFLEIEGRVEDLADHGVEQGAEPERGAEPGVEAAADRWVPA